jgi:hypothetical protein
MAYQLEGNGLEVDGVKFGLFVPTITEEALKLMQQEEAKCVSCHTWFSRITSNALYVEYNGEGWFVEVCPYCAEDYYPEAVVFV